MCATRSLYLERNQLDGVLPLTISLLTDLTCVEAPRGVVALDVLLLSV
jgi:hypothetical protein